VRGRRDATDAVPTAVSGPSGSHPGSRSGDLSGVPIDREPRDGL